MHVLTVPSTGMREPPYDDSLWPALILLLFAALFTFGLLLVMWAAEKRVVFAPTPSTLAPLGQTPPGTLGTP
jgi:hypothetical protein